MAFTYTPGSASSFADLKAAVEAAVAANGWTVSSGVISASGLAFKLTPLDTGTFRYLRIEGGLGQSGSNLTTACPQHAAIVSGSEAVINFPINYEIFCFTDPLEVYVIVNYNSDFYQHLSFGKSDCEGAGFGPWFTATCGHNFNPSSTGPVSRVNLQVGNGYCGTSYSGFNLGFWFNTVDSYEANYFYSSLNTPGWKYTIGTNHYGSDWCAGLLTSLPSLSNEADVLIPVKVVQIMPDGGLFIAAQPKNARYCRIDNWQPGQDVPYGGENWKLYPFYRKNTAERNGIGWSTGAQHSGTFGFAIRNPG